jgi:hypothetical protein
MINAEAFVSHLEERGVEEELVDEVYSYIRRVAKSSALGERGKWLGSLLRAQEEVLK